MRNSLVALVGLFVLAAVAAPAADADPFSIDFGPDHTNSGAVHTFVLAVPTGIAGDATLDLIVTGDYNGVLSENATVTVDGLSLGIILDNNPANDAFDFPSGDAGLAGVPNVGSATIPIADFAPRIADGLITILVDPLPGVGSSTVEGTISWTVPEPSTAWLIGAGVLLLWRRRRA